MYTWMLAYGGYGRAIFLDEDNNFIPYEDLQDVHEEYGVFKEKKRTHFKRSV